MQRKRILVMDIRINIRVQGRYARRGNVQEVHRGEFVASGAVCYNVHVVHVPMVSERRSG